MIFLGCFCHDSLFAAEILKPLKRVVCFGRGGKKEKPRPRQRKGNWPRGSKTIQRCKVCPNFPRTDWLDGFESYTVISQSHLTLDSNYYFNDSYAANFIFTSFIRFIVFSTSDHIANKTYLNRTSLSVHCW